MVLRFANGRELVIQPQQRAPGVDLAVGKHVTACIRAECFQLTNDSGLFSGTVDVVEYSGPVRTCTVNTDAGKIEMELPASSGRVTVGQTITLTVSGSAVHLVASI